MAQLPQGIVVGYDDSPDSRAALEWGAATARLWRSAAMTHQLKRTHNRPTTTSIARRQNCGQRRFRVAGDFESGDPFGIARGFRLTRRCATKQIVATIALANMGINMEPPTSQS